MADNEKFWTKVKVKVVAGLVVLITFEIFTGGWFISTLWKVVKAIGGFLSYPIPLPLWAVFLLPFVGAGVVIGWKALVRWRRPTSTRIDGIDWEWEWEGRKPYSLVALCPECENELKDQRDGVKSENFCLVMCGRCDFLKVFDGLWGEVHEGAKKEIRRRLRTGKWKEEETKQLT